MPRWRHFIPDIIKLGDDALHTVVSPIEGPVNQLIKDAKDAYQLGKDVVQTVKGSKRNREGEIIPQYTSNLKRKFAGDPTGVAQEDETEENIKRSINTGSHGMSKHNSGDDVPVVPPPARIAKHVADYTTVKMTYFDYVDLSASSGVSRHYIRLNSIYDAVKTAASTTTTLDKDANWVHEPAGRAVWEAIYKYYRVLSCDVNLTFINNTTFYQNSDSAVEFNRTPKMCGYIPVEGDTDAEAPRHWQHWVERKHSKTELMDPGHIRNQSAWTTGSAVTSSTVLQNISKGLGLIKKMHYKFSPDNWDYHVTPDAEDERWTLMTSTPAIERNLCLLAGNAGEGASFDDVHEIRCYYHLSYVVQLRELKDDLLYKTATKPTQE